MKIFKGTRPPADEPVRSRLGGLAGTTGPERTSTPSHDPASPGQDEKATTSRGKGLGRAMGRVRERRADRSLAMANTAGTGAATRLAQVLVCGAVLAGPVALWQTASTAATPAPAPVVTTAGQASMSDSTLAGDVAVRVLTAWSGATISDQKALGDLGLNATLVPQQPLKVTAVRLAQVSEDPSQKGSGVFQVLLAANVDGRPVYFRVPVQVREGSAFALGLPTPAPTPPVTEAQVDYTVRDLAPSSPVAGTIAAFLQAYLAGGDVTRYTAPGAVVLAPSAGGLPFERVIRVDASGDRDALEAATPGEGDVTRVVVTYAMSTSTGPVSGQMALSLKARAGRWEVVQVDPAPALSPLKPGPAASRTPAITSPTGTGPVSDPLSPDTSTTAPTVPAPAATTP